MSSSFANLGPIFMKKLLNCSASSFLSVICFSLILKKLGVYFEFLICSLLQQLFPFFIYHFEIY